MQLRLRSGRTYVPPIAFQTCRNRLRRIEADADIGEDVDDVVVLADGQRNAAFPVVLEQRGPTGADQEVPDQFPIAGLAVIIGCDVEHRA